MIGRTLDKYRIIEEVGQGGMAVVYRGIDTSLQREVAVKVLHPHLASHEEARARFEREAHAVAKLRHENILEIFDYSGKDSPDAYIITEFIRGRTLKGIVTDHVPAFPEIGAMIVVEVCRALVHAHALGVLHRDVKPENIMVRDDGIVKLTDFGIAQIVDAQRMTMTGQLLGSPAYMSPEHVEGQPIDFRTDVFAVGILLFQLTTGDLPFKGKNPHEILKRIADCKYQDARLVNPLIADRLNRIICRALEREPDDRYPDMAPMLDDLGRFLADVELGDPRAELIKFFQNPLSFEQALRQRLISVLSKRGRAELEGKRTAHAIELFNRVLTIDPRNEEVLAHIERLQHRRRLTNGSLAAIGICIVGGLGFFGLRAALRPLPPVVIEDPGDVSAGSTNLAAVAAAAAARLDDAGVPAVAVVAAQSDAGVHPGYHPVQPTRPKDPPVKHPDPAKPPETQATRDFVINPSPKSALYSIDGGETKPANTGRINVELGPGAHHIVVSNPLCEDQAIDISADEPGGLARGPPAVEAGLDQGRLSDGARHQRRGTRGHGGHERPDHRLRRQRPKKGDRGFSRRRKPGRHQDSRRDGR